MNNSSNFFSDPKVLLSLLALLVSLCALIWTISNQYEQNRRWDKLNAANPIVSDIKMLRWKKLSKDQAFKMSWGYKPTIFGSGDLDDMYILPYRLVVRESLTNELISSINSCYTIEEVEAELTRIKFKGKVNVLREFTIKIELLNKGKTDVNDLGIQVDAKIDEEDWQSAFTSNAVIALSTEQNSTIHFKIEFPVQLSLPNVISLKIHMLYKDVHSNSLSKVVNAKWTSVDNFWSYSKTD